MRLARILLCLVFASCPVYAQEARNDPLVVSFVPIPPFAEFDANGARTGFLIELARMIGSEIGVPIELLDVANSKEFVEAQVSGRTQMIAGVARLPALEDTNVFSAPLATELLRFATLEDRAHEFSGGAVLGKRVGVVPPAIGSETLFLANEFIEFQTPEAAVMGLLMGNVDALLMPEPTVYSIARKSRVDGRLTFAGAPLRQFERFIALHESRADLLEPINRALDRMRKDGRLDDLLFRHSVVIPQQAPQVLKVGVFNLPPHMMLGPDGRATGFAVEAMRDIAELADLDLNFVPIDARDFLPGPTHDILPILSVTKQRRDAIDFAFPIESSQFSIFLRSEDPLTVEGLFDLDLRRTAVLNQSLEMEFAEASGVENLVVYDRDSQAGDFLEDLLGGRIDAVLFETATLRKTADEQGVAGEITEVIPPFLSSERAPALRLGLGGVREQLNAVIPGYLLSDRYAELRQTYFGKPEFWTETRIYGALGGAAVLTVLMLAYLFLQNQWQRQAVLEQKQRELDREHSHTEKLGELVSELERSNRELDEFAYTASHDLKEPLRGIAINANFLGREELSEKGRERVERMVVLTTRMEKLVSDLLYFSRLGRGERVMKDVDSSHIVDGIRKELVEWLTEQNGVIKQMTPLPWVRAERSKVKAVFQNLIVNGLKYNDARDKRVEIGFDANVEVNGAIMSDVFWVRDNGIGIEERHRDKIFRIFQRLNREADYGAGTGAGLSFVRKIVEEYQGTATFTSQPGQGTTFYFTLPLAKTDIEKIA